MIMWKNDNFFVGALSALILSVATAIMILFLGPLVYPLLPESSPVNKLMLLSPVPALFLMRYYMRKLRFDKAGMGALAIVFILIIVYFVFVEGKPVSLFH